MNYIISRIKQTRLVVDIVFEEMIMLVTLAVVVMVVASMLVVEEINLGMI